MVSILANELSKIKNLKIILFTGAVENEEFHLESKIIRLIVYNTYGRSYYLNYNYMKIIFDNFNIDVVIYNRIFLNQIQFLLTLKKKLILIYHFQYLYFSIS